MKKQLVILCIAFIPLSAFAKKDSGAKKNEYGNSFFVGALRQAFPKTYKIDLQRSPYADCIADVLGLFYERRINKNIGIGTGFSEWTPFKSLYKNIYPDGEEEVKDGPRYDPIYVGHERGKIETIECYKMVDLDVTYKYNKFKKHKIGGGIGISYTWGINTVIDTVYVYSVDAVIIAHQQSAHYYGGFVFVSYDYLCLHNRIAVGYQVKWRQYFGLYSPQLVYGFNLKFNF